MGRLFTSIRLLFLFLSVFILIYPLQAQQNGGFESWSPSGSPPPFDWKFPTGWTANNATTEFITAGVTRNTYHHSGEFAAQIKTLNIFGTLTRSQLALGNCKLDYPHYQVNAFSGGEPLNMIPDQVSFYYQLTTGVPSEYAVAEILIKRPTGSYFPDTVYHESIVLTGVDIFTEALISIPDVGVNTATDSIVILFSSNDTNEVALNTLYIDDVSIDFVSATDPDPLHRNSLLVFPNPVKSGESLTIIHSSPELNDLKILDSTGRVMECGDESGNDGNIIRIFPFDLPAGVYCVVVDGRYASRFVVSGEW